MIIQITADGSPTLYRPDIDEHYHSTKGALAESRHVYVATGWRAAPRSADGDPVRVFEVGFGAGLNAALTAEAALAERTSTLYYSVELYPLPAETAAALAAGYPADVRGTIEAVNRAPWDTPVAINPFFTLHKLHDSLLTMELPARLDAVYFDAFAPEKQPEMWGEPVFRRLFAAMRPGGVLTTYCAKGSIRRLLEQIGFRCERLPGPPSGKREILRAVKPAL